MNESGDPMESMSDTLRHEHPTRRLDVAMHDVPVEDAAPETMVFTTKDLAVY
jgi:hypothetical protein